MGLGSIGIKLADNKFFPIMDGSHEGSKTLELTTVSKNQESVQIHLYRSKEDGPRQTIDNADYIGTLVIGDIAKKPAGDPTIKLKIAIDGDELLSAEAQDMDSGARQSLNVSLKELPAQASAPAPGFDVAGTESEGLSFSVLDKGSMENKALADAPVDKIPPANAAFSGNPPGLAPSEPAPETAEQEEPFAPKDLYSSSEAEQASERRGVFIPAWLCVLILVVGIALLAVALIFAWRLFFDHSAASRGPSSQAAFVSPEFASNQAGAAPREPPRQSFEPVAPPDPSSELASDQAGAAPMEAPQQPSSPAAALPASSFARGSGAATANSDPAPVPPVAEEPTPPPVPQGSAAAVGVAEPEPPAPVPPVAEEPTPPPVPQGSAAAVEVAEPEPPKPLAPAPAARDVRYTVKLGDTLWDLAETFYRDPWRFSDIARRNGIKNPSLIVVGTSLIIPAE